MKDQHQPDFTVRMFGMFSLKKDEPVFSNFTYFKENEPIRSPYFIEEKSKKDDPSIGMLDPQVRKFLSAADDYAVKYFTMAASLKDELNRTVWKSPVPKYWEVEKLRTMLIEEEDGLYFKFKISGVTALRFPTDILALYICIDPCLEPPLQNIKTLGKMMTNVLKYAGVTSGEKKFKPALIKRLFTNEKQKESIEKRMGKSESGGLVDGLRGEEVSMGDIMWGFLTSNCESLMGDRFLTYTFLKTDWDGQKPAFTTENYIDLVRLSRGESDNYQPYEAECGPGNHGLVNTFENVAFALAGEGSACWVKADEKQLFLHTQFRERYETIYMNLYLLALHQKYALTQMALRLDGAAKKGDVTDLRNLRKEVATFYLRAFFQQPAILTNHQEFYSALQAALGVSNLLEEVQHAVLESDYLIGDAHEKEKRDEQNKQHGDLLANIKDLISEQEKTAQNELALTLVVEAVALPYYLYNILAHIFHLPRLVSVPFTLLVTLVTIAFTYCKFKKKGRKFIFRILCRLFERRSSLPVP